MERGYLLPINGDAGTMPLAGGHPRYRGIFRLMASDRAAQEVGTGTALDRAWNQEMALRCEDPWQAFLKDRNAAENLAHEYRTANIDCDVLEVSRDASEADT